MEKEKLNGQMVIFMKDFFKIVKKMDMECINMQIKVENMKDFGQMIKKKDKGFYILMMMKLF